MRVIVALLALAVLTLPGLLVAQSAPDGSRYLPTDHWAYVYIDRLLERGLLDELDPLVRPYRRSDVIAGLRAIDRGALREPVATWVRLLRQGFDAHTTNPAAESDRDYRLGGELVAGARAANTDRLDPLRPVGQGSVWPYGELAGWLEIGPVAAVSRVRSDAWFPDDPDGLDVGRRLEARSQEAYLSAQFPVVSLFLGRMARNWGPAGGPGLMVSDNPATYPHLGFELEVGPIALHSMLAELDTFPPGPDTQPAEPVRRYLAAHRLSFTPSPDLTISLGEGVVYAAPGASASIRFLNPVDVLFFDNDNPPADFTPNLMLDGQLWWRPAPFVVYLEFLLDDIDLFPPEGRETVPTRYALRGGARWPGARRWLDLSLDYTLVSSYAYRSVKLVDDARYLERGLGENFSDFDRLRLRADLYPGLPGLTLSPELAILRQGEGDIREPAAITLDELAGMPGLFLGQKETTFRFGLAGRYQPLHFLWLAWDIGANIVRDAGHVRGRDEEDFTATAAAGFRLPL